MVKKATFSFLYTAFVLKKIVTKWGREERFKYNSHFNNIR